MAGHQHSCSTHLGGFPLPDVCIFGTSADSTTVTIAGEVDAAGCAVVAAALQSVWAGQPDRLDVDVTRVTFLGTDALAALIDARRTADHRGVTFSIRAHSPYPKRQLTLMGLGALTDTVPTLAFARPQPSARPGRRPPRDRSQEISTVAPLKGPAHGQRHLHLVGTQRSVPVGPPAPTGPKWPSEGPVTSDLQTALHTIAMMAAACVPGAESAGVWMRVGADTCQWHAATDYDAQAAETLQQVLNQGPAWLSARVGLEVISDDLGHDARWPDLASDADGLSIRSVFSIPLTTSHTVQAVLTLYSPAAGAFEPDRLATARLIAAGTATAILTRALHYHHLTRLLSNQQIMGHALSILKARYHLSDDAALELLGPHL